VMGLSVIDPTFNGATVMAVLRESTPNKLTARSLVVVFEPDDIILTQIAA
jgi:hypothetical protein